MKPIQGNPGHVAKAGETMIQGATKMKHAADTLLKLTQGEDYRSEAIDAISGNANELATVMQGASVRYRGTGEALAEYAPVLAQAQQEVNAAISQMASTDVHAAQVRAFTAAAEDEVVRHNPFSSDEDRARHSARAHAAAEDLADQRQRAAAAASSYEAAMEMLDRAAARAVGKIVDADKASNLNDSFWDNFAGFIDDIVSPALKTIHEILSKVSDLLAAVEVALLLAAAVTAWIPGVGEAFMLAARVIGIAGSIVTLLDFDVQLMRFVIGDISFAEVLVAGALAVISALTFGEGGALARGGIKLAKKAVGEGTQTVVTGYAGHSASGDAERITEEADPGTFWAPRGHWIDGLRTDDVDPVQGDPSSVDGRSIVEAKFGRPIHSDEIVCSSYQSNYALAA